MKQFHLFLTALLLAGGLLLGGCFSSKQIRSTGLKGLSIGDPMPDASVTRLLGHHAYDTLIEEGSFSWRGFVVKHPSGDVLVESDHVNRETINRIQVRARGLRYQKKISVGSTVGDLNLLKGRWYLTHLPDYQRVDITIEGLHFLISDAFIPSNPEAPLERAQIPESAPILAIVLM